MEFFRIHKDIPFMKHALVFNVISLITFLLAVFFLATKGLHFSVEFTGGTLMEVSYTEAPALEKLRDTLAKEGYQDAQVQNFGSSRDVLIRLPNREGMETGKVSEKVMASLSALEGGKPELRRVEFVGPQVGKELASDGAMALLLVIGGIVLYLAMRFEWRFAVSAIIANLHDVIIILGFFALFQWEFSLPVLAATLAVLGYSVNESVVVFDRVRETFKKKRGLTTPQVLDHAITSTISRTIITHGSTQIMVLSMLLFGGETLHYFAVALTIGILFGIYSSVFVAAAIAMWLGIRREDLVKGGGRKEGDPNDPNAGGMHGGGFGGGFGDMGDIFGDIFGDLFGGGRSRRNDGPMKGANLRTAVRITFDESVKGCEKELKLNLKDPCPTCHGSGAKQPLLHANAG